jgi:hypothetical protein
MEIKVYVISLLTVLLAFFFLMFTVAAWSEGTVYTGTEKTIVCTNPTARTDGTPLSVNEIDRVEIYISQTDTGSNPLIPSKPFTVIMAGGCVDTPFDLTVLPEGQHYMYGVTYDTAGRVSAYSASLPFIRDLLPPMPPVIWE